MHDCFKNPLQIDLSSSNGKQLAIFSSKEGYIQVIITDAYSKSSTSSGSEFNEVSNTRLIRDKNLSDDADGKSKYCYENPVPAESETSDSTTGKQKLIL